MHPAVRPNLCVNSEARNVRPSEFGGHYLQHGRRHRGKWAPVFFGPKLRVIARVFRCGRLQRGPLEDVVLGDLDRLEAEHPHRLDQDQAAGDDRRRAIRVEARHRAPFLERQRGEHRAGCASQRRASAGSRRRARGRRARGAVDRGERRRRAGDGDAVGDVRRTSRRRAARARRGPPRGSAPARPSVGGSEWRWRSRVAHRSGLRRDVERDLRAAPDHELGAAAADVDDEQRRARSCGRWSRRGR